MFKVARLNPIASIGTDLFTGKYEMTENLAEASAVLVRSASTSWSFRTDFLRLPVPAPA